uniref:Histone H1.9 n=1 Tax=Peromyscus maniculatus bairdii TaxID=230844 RepID=A0A8C8URT6_PERMB
QRHTSWHLAHQMSPLSHASELPKKRQWVCYDPHRILPTSQWPPEVIAEITSPAPEPTAQVCLSIQCPAVIPGRDAERHIAGVTIYSPKFCDDPSKSETGPYTCPQTVRKPSMSKVILRAVADKGLHRRVSLVALKKAVSTTGYNMAHNSWRFKRAVENLVKKGMLKQVTGKGASGSFRLGKKQAFKSKRKAKRRQRRQRRQKPRQRRSGPRQSLLGSGKSHKGLFKGVRRGARGRRH